MENLYYVVEKELRTVLAHEETTDNKLIRVYDINTQSMSLVVVCEIETTKDKNSEEEIQFWLDSNGRGEQEYNLVQL